MESKAESILLRLRSGKTSQLNEALLDIKKLWDLYIEEKWKKRPGKAATETLRLLRDEFIEMCSSPDWQSKYAALRGLSRMNMSDVFDERIEKMVELFLTMVVDEKGLVRRAAVYTFGQLRPIGKFTEDMYASLYLILQEMFNKEKDPKKKASIEQALVELSCPMLDMILDARGFQPVEEDPSFAL